jgi:hypothetical protein
MRLYCARRPSVLGVWNPSDIDFGQDARDWEGVAVSRGTRSCCG